jgi:uncharacterized protein YjiS (DUF1127 family)
MFDVFNYFVNQASTWFQRTIAYNKAFEELHRLTDRELADLGIYRCEIHNVITNTLRDRIPSQSFS